MRLFARIVIESVGSFALGMLVLLGMGAYLMLNANSVEMPVWSACLAAFLIGRVLLFILV